MFTTGLEDATRPRAVTAAAAIVMIQTVLWIASLAFGLMQIQARTVAVLNESWEPWIVPAAHFLRHLLRPSLLEGFAIIVLAVAVLKKKRWARRPLEFVILVRGLLAVSNAATFVGAPPWIIFSGVYPALVWAPAVLLALPLPVIIVLLEKPEGGAWFRRPVPVRPDRGS